jgi:hypothetical protein
MTPDAALKGTIKSAKSGMSTSTHIRVLGPNLSELAQRDGQFHVHADDCPDHQHYGLEGKFGGVDD